MKSQGQATALRWWSREQLDSLAAGVESGWEQALRDWGVPYTPAGVAGGCENAHAAGIDASGEWELLGRKDICVAWLAADARPESRLAKTLFGLQDGAVAGPVAAHVTERAWQDLQSRLRGALGLDDLDAPSAQPGAADFLPWSGNVCMRLAWPHSPIVVLINAACAQALLGHAASAAQVRSAMPLTPLALALESRPLTLRVELSACELDLGALQALHVGDIVRLPHPLDVPLRMTGPGEEVLCAAYLGVREGIKAVELAVLPAGSGGEHLKN